MFDFYFMITTFVILAGVLSLKKNNEYSISGKTNLNSTGKIFFVVIFVTLVIFQATRTTHNDTYGYTIVFNAIDSSEAIFEHLFEPYGGYKVLQIVTKRLTSNVNVLFLFCALFINYVFLKIIFKYSKDISQSLLLFFLGDFLFSMAGLKQAIAMTFVLIAIDLYVNNKKYLYFIPIVIGYLFHPYVIIMLVIPLLSKKPFSVKTLLLVFALAVAFINLDTVFSFFAEIGNDYSTEDLSTYTINPFRVIIEFIPVGIMFIGRKKIDKLDDDFVTVGVNMCAVSWFFVFIGLFINPIYPGRLATYFNVLYSMIMPTVLGVTFKNNPNRKIIYFVFYLVMIIYFLLDFTHFGNIPISYDRFHHVSILYLFNWR